MNLDLLKKLIRLAANNSNENEANTAARRVCKMIYDAELAGENISFIELSPKNNNPFDFDIDAEFFTNLYRKNKNRNYKPPEPKVTTSRILNCSKCNNPITTQFVGPPQVFVCYPCQMKW